MTFKKLINLSNSIWNHGVIVCIFCFWFKLNNYINDVVVMILGFHWDIHINIELETREQTEMSSICYISKKKNNIPGDCWF